jgi:hypothetical protein
MKKCGVDALGNKSTLVVEVVLVVVSQNGADGVAGASVQVNAELDALSSLRLIPIFVLALK